MLLGLTGRRLAAALLPLLSVLLAYVVLQRPAPLFVNLGAGDEELVHGFREDWERDGPPPRLHTVRYAGVLAG